MSVPFVTPAGLRLPVKWREPSSIPSAYKLISVLGSSEEPQRNICIPADLANARNTRIRCRYESRRTFPFPIMEGPTAIHMSHPRLWKPANWRFGLDVGM